MIEVIFSLGVMESCITLSVQNVVFDKKQRLLDIEISQKLKKDPATCGVVHKSNGYKWIVVDKSANQIDMGHAASLPEEIGLKNQIVINNQMLPRDFKPPLTFKVIKTN